MKIVWKRMKVPPDRTGFQFIGFTLIELMIVIAIIAILASLLIPSLNKAKSIAIRIKCQSNMKQISHAMHQYIGDYDGYQPKHYISYLSRRWWYHALNPYFGKLESASMVPVFKCDTLPVQLKIARGATADYTLTRYRYANDGWYFDDGAPNKYWIRVGTLSKKPSRTVQFFDGIARKTYEYNGQKYQTHAINYFYHYKAEHQIIADWRHGAKQFLPYTSEGSDFVKGINGQCNMMFIDGHVKALQRKDIDGVSVPMHDLD